MQNAASESPFLYDRVACICRTSENLMLQYLDELLTRNELVDTDMFGSFSDTRANLHRCMDTQFWEKWILVSASNWLRYRTIGECDKLMIELLQL